MTVSMLGVDLGKNSVSVVGLDDRGAVVLRRRLNRDSLMTLLSKLSPCKVAMEACGGAHHIGRAAQVFGHDVRLMPPEYVRPYVKAQKNDDRDAEAIAEAATRPTMRFVPIKEASQLDTQALHRARDRLVAERTALINQLRALLLERGIVLPQRRRALLDWLDAPIAEGETDPLSPRLRLLVSDIRAEWAELDRRIGVFDDEFATAARSDEATRRVATIPGIGPINATALVAAVGDARAFARARDMSAWLGLVPRQASTGGRAKLLGITKRGSRYLRKNLIHGARAVLPKLAATDTRLHLACARLPVPIPVAIALDEPIRVLLPVGRPRHRADLQFHQAFRRKTDHLAQKVRIRGLLDKVSEVHHAVGHRGALRSRVGVSNHTLPDHLR